MDKTDQKLLYELELKSNEKDSILAKKLKTSKQVIGYRIKRLTSENIIKQFQTVLNISNLGVPIWAHIYFKLLEVTKEKEEEITKYLAENKKIGYLAILGGRFDLSIVLVAKNIQELEFDLEEITSKFPEQLKSYDIILRTFGWKFPKKYLLQEKNIAHHKVILSKETDLVQIDSIDISILKEITKNSRISIMDLRKKLDIPFSTVRSRIKSLEKKKVIAGYSILLDLQKIGYNNYKVFMKTKDNSKDAFNTLREFASSHPNVTYFMKTFGEHNYELRFEVESQEKFQDVIKEIRSKFSEIIDGLETVIIFKELKEDFSAVLEHLD
ncbi:Lrp/AsnC family transcriptional regulator [Candidatus Woesearchaeota archaeon]|nr:Lrp/AsnC family transcriptional regulator [Candidatus Woesearchaeota archaeon]